MMSELDKSGFERIGFGVEKATRVGQSLFGRWVDRFTPSVRQESMDWAVDADWAQLQQEPLRARRLLRIAAWVLVLLVLWAAFAKVDEVARGEARVVPTSQVQVVQSVDGGVLEEILVREGQHVEAGQLLARVDPTRFASNLGESRASQLALQAKVLRLQALTQGGLSIPRPSSCAMRPTSWRRSAACTNRAAPNSTPSWPCRKTSWRSACRSSTKCVPGANRPSAAWNWRRRN